MKNLRAKTRVVANEGGARSTKSYSIMQLFVTRYLLNGHGNRLLFLRKSLPSFRISNYVDFKEIRDDNGLEPYLHEEKVNLNYFFKKHPKKPANWLHFGSLDDFRKIKSTGFHKIVMEEADEFTYEDYYTLKLRLSAKPTKTIGPNQIFLLYNPANEFSWVKTRVIDKETNLTVIPSTYLDNPFLTKEYVENIEELQDYDPDLWKIYGLGQWGTLSGLIYNNWDEVDYWPEGGETIYGLDYGFNHPTALTEFKIKDGRDVYERELLYKRKLTNKDLIDELKELIPAYYRGRPIYADPSEPDRIQEIKNAGFNIHPGDNRVVDGILFVKRFRVHILSSSTNIIKEKKSYSWAKDKNGDPLDPERPVKFHDHGQDSERYALYSHLGKRQPLVVNVRRAGRGRISQDLGSY